MMPYFDDDGTEYNPDLVPKPALCVACRNDTNPNHDMLCTLTRLDQQGQDAFQCFAYTPKTAEQRHHADESYGSDLSF